MSSTHDTARSDSASCPDVVIIGDRSVVSDEFDIVNVPGEVYERDPPSKYAYLFNSPLTVVDVAALKRTKTTPVDYMELLRIVKEEVPPVRIDADVYYGKVVTALAARPGLLPWLFVVLDSVRNGGTVAIIAPSAKKYMTVLRDVVRVFDSAKPRAALYADAAFRDKRLDGCVPSPVPFQETTSTIHFSECQEESASISALSAKTRFPRRVTRWYSADWDTEHTDSHDPRSSVKTLTTHGYAVHAITDAGWPCVLSRPLGDGRIWIVPDCLPRSEVLSTFVRSVRGIDRQLRDFGKPHVFMTLRPEGIPEVCRSAQDRLDLHIRIGLGAARPGLEAGIEWPGGSLRITTWSSPSPP